jgi:hypothetical protein
LLNGEAQAQAKFCIDTFGLPLNDELIVNELNTVLVPSGTLIRLPAMRAAHNSFLWLM